MIMLRTTSHFVVLAFIAAIRNIPTVASAEPNIASVRYRPVRLIILPAATLDNTAPINSGVSSDPDRVAEIPSTPCMKRGT